MQIRDVIARRTDLSTFIVHLTRDDSSSLAGDKLEGILRDREILAKSIYGMAKGKVASRTPEGDCQRVVCFTETPLEHVHLLTEKITGRQFKFEPYGIALPKMLARKSGVNPVWYVDITPGHDWLMNALDQLMDSAMQSVDFSDSAMSRLAPFIEQMGRRDGHYKKEFWWEREWRHCGDFRLPRRFIIACPEPEIDRFRSSFTPRRLQQPPIAYIDPSWSLEQIIARLAGFDSAEVDLL